MRADDGPVTGARIAGRLEPGGRGRTFVHGPYAIVRAQMQTTLARRQRHRTSAASAPPEGGWRPSSVRRILIAIPIILVLVSLLTAGAGALFTVAAYNYYAQGLPDPKEALTNLEFEQQTIVYDRTGKVELARLGSLRREVVDVRRDPRRDARRDDRDRGQGLLGEPGLRPRRHRVSAGLDTLVGPAARRLDDHPAAGPGATPAARGVRAADLRAQDPGDHPVGPPDRGVPGPGGQAGDHHRLPEPELLRQQQLRREGGRQGLLRQGARGPDPRRSTRSSPAIPQSPTKFDLIKNADEVCLDEPPAEPEATTESATKTPSSSRSDPVDRDRPAAQLHPGADEDPQPADRATSTPAASTRRPRTRPSSSTPPVSATLAGAALRVAGPRGARRRSCARTRPTTATRSTPAGTGSRRRSTGRCRRSPRSTSTRRRARPTPRTHGRSSSRARSRRGTGTGSSTCAAATSTTPRRPSSTTGPARSSPTSAAPATRRRAPRSSSPQFDVLADGWRQPGSAIKPIDYLIGIDDKTLTASTMFMDVTTDFGGGFTADPGRQARARPGPPAQRPPVLAQHPGHQGDGHQRPRPRLRAHAGLRDRPTRARPSRSSRWASARSRCTRSTCSAPTARSPTAAS